MPCRSRGLLALLLAQNLNAYWIMEDSQRIVITGIGLTAPNGNSLEEFRQNLLNCKPNIQRIPMRYMGEVLAGLCNFDPLKHQSRKELRNGTRAGSIGIYCASEAIASSKLNFEGFSKSRVGIYIGITEHGNVETENEIFSLSQFNYDTKYWSHHHNPRTIANNPAGEVSIHLKITGPHYTIGAACAAGNAGIIQGVQMLRLGEVDLALVGGVSESCHTFGIFASFKNQGALADHEDPNKASRPFDLHRNGIVVSEGGCIFTLERLSDALKRKAPIFGEVVGYCINSDATDAVLPHSQRQKECMEAAIKKANLSPQDIDLISSHATATIAGDIQECKAIKELFNQSASTFINNTKSFIGHTMGAAGALELAGNLPSFIDRKIHPTLNIDNLDPECNLPNIIMDRPIQRNRIDTVLNNSFGMLGINSSIIVKKL